MGCALDARAPPLTPVSVVAAEPTHALVPRMGPRVLMIPRPGDIDRLLDGSHGGRTRLVGTYLTRATKPKATHGKRLSPRVAGET